MTKTNETNFENVKIPSYLLEELRKQKQKTGITIVHMIIKAVSDYLKKGK